MSKEIKITLNIDGHRNILQQEINAHLSELRLIINTEETININENTEFFSWHINKPDLETLVNSQIEKSYKGIITSLQDYIDRLLAVIELAQNGRYVGRDLNSPDELVAYLHSKELEILKKISTNTSMLDKLKKIIPNDNVMVSYIQKYFFLRNAMEHHKSFPKDDIELEYKKISAKIDNKIELDGPMKVEAGQRISFPFKDVSKKFLKDELIIIKPNELDDIAYTILLHIGLILMQSTKDTIKNNRDTLKG